MLHDPRPIDPLASFQQKILKVLGYCPTDILADGNMHRFATSTKPKDNAGWYVCFQNPTDKGIVYAGSFGDHRQGIKAKWHSSHPGKAINLSDATRLALHPTKQMAQDELSQKYEQASQIAQAQWQHALPVEVSHPYLQRKAIKAYGIRQYQQALLIPIRDEHGKIWSLQYIYPDGHKLFLKNGAIQGHFFVIGPLDTTIPLCLCEGYATGATIHQVTGYPVIGALSANNLKPVALILRKQYPDRKIILCADNDDHLRAKGQLNIGVEKAREAACAIGAHLAIPPIPTSFQPSIQSMDFNDFYNLSIQTQSKTLF